VSIIGWSAGGIYAREIARVVPQHVRMVITLGSPFRGSHRASHAWRAYALLKTTCIFSKKDGVVASECCTSLPAPLTENVEVNSTHFGFRHNLETLGVIADRLAQPENRWRPYQPTRLRRPRT
jgi:hypothetical protein